MCAYTHTPHTEILEPLFVNILESNIFGQDVELDTRGFGKAAQEMQGCPLGVKKTQHTTTSACWEVWNQGLDDLQIPVLPVTWDS